MKNDIHGSITALITPFKNGAIDEAAFQNMIAWQLQEGTHGFVVNGTTGESPTLSDDETERLFRMAMEAAHGRPVIAGCGSNDTEHAIHLTRIANRSGVRAALHVSPYYNRPTQDGLRAHFKAIHDAVDLPIIIYNIPGRTAVTIHYETMVELAKLQNIIGVKDSTGDLTQPVRLREACKPGFIQFTGDDPLALPYLVQGGDGCISVTSNIAPRLCRQFQDAWREGRVKEAQAINAMLLPLHDALFCETSPGPVKYAAARLGLCNNELRLPLVPVQPESERRVDAAMARLRLTSP